MPKYQVEGIIRVQMTVEADSEDDALMIAEEEFEVKKHLQDPQVSFEAANEIDNDEDEDHDTGGYGLQDEDENDE